MSRGRGHEPERTCIVCRKKQKKRQLLRLVLREDCVVIDTLKKLPGRGAYTCNNDKCIDMALKNYRNCLNRAFKTGRIRVEPYTERDTGRLGRPVTDSKNNH